jgi:hypothetical protein
VLGRLQRLGSRSPWREVYVVVDGLGSFISGVRVMLCKAADLEFVGSILRSKGETKDLAKNLRML